ncbi:hypothetical protein KAR48_12760 [bacterium]|nr:hypothetical protein [bacterium]
MTISPHSTISTLVITVLYSCTLVTPVVYSQGITPKLAARGRIPETHLSPSTEYHLSRALHLAFTDKY